MQSYCVRLVDKGSIMTEEIIQEGTIEEKNDVVDAKAYEQIKNDMHKFKREAAEAKQAKEEAEKRAMEFETRALENQENYKELYEKQKGLTHGIESKYKELTSTIVNDRRMSAIKTEAMKLGINNDFVDLLEAFDTSDVLVETTSSGKITVSGADTWVETLKASKPSMFSKKEDPRINNKTGNYDGREKTYSPAEILKLEKDDPVKYREIVTTKRHLIK